MDQNPEYAVRDTTAISVRTDADSDESLDENPFLSEPMKISSGICCAVSLLMEITSLSTSYWVLESTPKGLIHSGLWKICMDPVCTTYEIHSLAPHIHLIRGFLTIACVCGLISLICICISFENLELFGLMMIPAASCLSFIAGLLIMISMSAFTGIYRSSQAYSEFLVIFGSSYSLGWASIALFAMTGMLLVLTHKTIDSELEDT